MSPENKLILLRTENKLSQEQIAKKIEVSLSTYRRLEKDASGLSFDVLSRLLNLYNLSFEEFSGMSLPVVRTTVYPSKFIIELRKSLMDCVVVDDYVENLKRFNLLQEKLSPILEVRDEVLSFPQLNLEMEPTGITTLTVKLDMVVEALIRKTIERQMQLLHYRQD